jgi:hypothetical protein
MKHTALTVGDIINHIDDAVMGRIDIPEFQRGFVWSPEKAKNLVDSLWREYPIGTILLWESKYAQPKLGVDATGQKQWVVDGQQRITTLALLFGKKPYWWPSVDEWKKYLEKYDVMVDLSKPKDALEFGLPNPIRRKSPNWVSVREILRCDDLAKFAENKAKVLKQPFSEVYNKLDSIKRIEKYPLYEIIIDHEVEDVAEIFTRLNMGGVKIRESDVILALIAVRQEGWVREHFNPYLEDLEDKGFKLDPAILIRSFAAIATGNARLRSIPDDFWYNLKEFKKGWDKTKASISYIVHKMQEVGVLSSDLLPSHNALIPLFALCDRFGKSFAFEKAFHWFLIATRDGRYSGSAITVLDQDIKSINSSASFYEAIEKLTAPLRAPEYFEKEDFLSESRDDFLRLMLYLIIFKSGAKDWLSDVRIGYDKTTNMLNEGYKPEWHHFFPKKCLRTIRSKRRK